MRDNGCNKERKEGQQSGEVGNKGREEGMKRGRQRG